MAIVVLILWFATAGGGVALLRAGGTARRLANASLTTTAALAAQPAAGVPARIGAVPLTEDGKPPPVPHVRVMTPEGEHPLLEFAHPALAITGLAFWAMFTFVHYRPMAWISVAILLAVIGLGFGWQARNRADARSHPAAAWPFPARLLTLHAVSAGSSLVLAVLATLVASHG